MLRLFLTSETVGSGANTPANDRWILSIAFKFRGNLSETIRHVTFLANGSIDTTSTSSLVVQEITSLLEPTLSAVRLILGESFDFWRIINLFVVGYYWILLADLGQISPTTYPPVNQYLRLVDFSSPQYHSSMNNIFRNATLFTYYTSYLNDLLNKTLGSSYLLPDFIPLDNQNLLNATDTTIIRMYTCLQRQMKHPVNLLLSVLGVSLSLITTISVVFSFFAARLEYRSDLCQHAVDLERNNDDLLSAMNPVNNPSASARSYSEDGDRVAQDPQLVSIAPHELPSNMSTRGESMVQASTSSTTGRGD